MVEITEAEQNKEEDSLRDLWDNTMHTQPLNYMGPGRRREKETVGENTGGDYSQKLP